MPQKSLYKYRLLCGRWSYYLHFRCLLLTWQGKSLIVMYIIPVACRRRRCCSGPSTRRVWTWSEIASLRRNRIRILKEKEKESEKNNYFYGIWRATEKWPKERYYRPQWPHLAFNRGERRRKLQQQATFKEREFFPLF